MTQTVIRRIGGPPSPYPRGNNAGGHHRTIGRAAVVPAALAPVPVDWPPPPPAVPVVERQPPAWHEFVDTAATPAAAPVCVAVERHLSLATVPADEAAVAEEWSDHLSAVHCPVHNGYHVIGLH